MMDTDKCARCGNTRQWHRENKTEVIHQFSALNDGQLSPPPPEDVATPRGRGIRPMVTPFDPVLRMALIDKGVLSTTDLEEAEAKIRFLTQGLGPAPVTRGSDDDG